jgi:hypothetical protein
MTLGIIRTTLSSLAVAAFAALPQIAAADDDVGAGTSPDWPLLREMPEDPPGAVRARDRLDARSAPRDVSVGPYVSVQVNTDEFDLNIVGDAANEPSIAIDPTDPDRMVIGWRQFDTIASNFRQAGWAFSGDGGQSWTFPGVLTPGVFRSDPVLDSDSSGNFYFQSLQETFDVDVFKSTDGGATWGSPVPSFGGDKNWMAIDKSGGIGDGHVYGIWQRFGDSCCGQNTFTRSTDGAASFETPLAVPFRPTFGTMAVGPDGEVYATGIDGTVFQNFNQFVIAKTDDAQDALTTPSFTGAQVEMGGSMGFGGGPNPDGLLGEANVAVDPGPGPTRGTVYILASVNPPGGDPLDVHLIRSSDGGASWSDPIRVNDDPTNNGAYQWLAAHSVAPNGRIDAVWYDTRNSGQTNISELFYAYSYDGGDSWRGNIPVSPAFDSFVGWPNQNKMGDYTTMISDESGAGVAYAATFNGEQDVYFLRVFPDCNENGGSDVDDINDQVSADANGNLIPDDCELLLAEPDPGIAGQPNTLTASLGTPGAPVIFVLGFVEGSSNVAACGDAFDIQAPALFGVVPVDGAGEAGRTVTFPAAASGLTLFFQALEFSTCTFSNRVEFTFP